MILSMLPSYTGPGVRSVLYDGENVVPVIVDIYGADVDTRGHDIHSGDVGEVDSGLHQLGLVLVKDILVLGGLDY